MNNKNEGDWSLVMPFILLIAVAFIVPIIYIGIQLRIIRKGIGTKHQMPLVLIFISLVITFFSILFNQLYFKHIPKFETHNDDLYLYGLMLLISMNFGGLLITALLKPFWIKYATNKIILNEKQLLF